MTLSRLFWSGLAGLLGAIGGFVLLRATSVISFSSEDEVGDVGQIKILVKTNHGKTVPVTLRPGGEPGVSVKMF
jgi:hypothetical protein